MLDIPRVEPDVETISQCLSPCDSCSGHYISTILRKRLLCRCECHQRKQTYWQAHFGCASQTRNNSVINRAYEKSFSTSLTRETEVADGVPISYKTGGRKKEMKKRKGSLQDASQVGSPQKRLEAPSRVDEAPPSGVVGGGTSIG